MCARILVIEDNPTNLELFVHVLEAAGHSVLAAGDGVAGVEAARSGEPDLVVCDIAMPRMNGFEVARCMKADPALRLIPLVAVTAHAMVGDRDAVIAAGFDGCLTKPINVRTLDAELQRFLVHQPVPAL